jgi:hypothetical protein
MTLVFTLQEDALDCVKAILQARRAYTMTRSELGEYEIHIPE